MPATPESLKPHWFYILLALAGGNLHGSAIMEEVLERTDGSLRLWPGTLYGSLKDLTDEGLIRETAPPEDAPTEGGKRRFYAITAAGRAALDAEADRLAALVRTARSRNVDLGTA